jgi:hypothetical protein
MTRERQGRAGSASRDEAGVRERLAELEERVAELGNACVVMERVHGTLDHAGVLAAIQDVVINVIGSEELAVYEVAQGGRSLRPVQSFGVERRDLRSLALGEGPIGRAVSERQIWTVLDGGPPPEDRELTAVAPLCAGERVAGAVAIWRMLEHKPIFAAAERTVLELLSRHGGTALHLTSLRSGRCAEAA